MANLSENTLFTSLFQSERLYTAAMSDKAKIQERISEIESLMGAADFWSDKDRAQETLKEYQQLKAKLEGKGVYDKSYTLVTIVSGAGGDDAEVPPLRPDRDLCARDDCCAQRLDARAAE